MLRPFYFLFSESGTSLTWRRKMYRRQGLSSQYCMIYLTPVDGLSIQKQIHCLVSFSFDADTFYPSPQREGHIRTPVPVRQLSFTPLPSCFPHCPLSHALTSQPPSTASSKGLSKTPITFSTLSSPNTSFHRKPCFMATPTDVTLQPTAGDSRKPHIALSVLPLTL